MQKVLETMVSEAVQIEILRALIFVGIGMLIVAIPFLLFLVAILKHDED